MDSSKKRLKEGEIVERVVDGKVVRRRVVRRKKVQNPNPKSNPKSATKGRGRMVVIIAINALVIALLGGVMLVVMHFALRGTDMGCVLQFPISLAHYGASRGDGSRGSCI